MRASLSRGTTIATGRRASVAPPAVATTGGSLTIRQWTGDPPDLGPFLNVSFRAQGFAGFCYSRLLEFGVGLTLQRNSCLPPGLPSRRDLAGWSDLLLQAARQRQVAEPGPLNGRAVTAADVRYPFERFRKISPQQGNCDMVKKVKAPDQQTVVFTLNALFAPFETSRPRRCSGA